MFHNILVAVDGSAPSDLAVEAAADLAESQNATLTIVTVCAVPWTSGVPQASLIRIFGDEENDAHDLLDRAMARVPPGLVVSTLTLWGSSVALAIVDKLEAGGHDLIVLGSRGRGPVRATLLGSDGRAVLERSPVPVLVVRPPRTVSATPQAAGTIHSRIAEGR